MHKVLPVLILFALGAAVLFSVNNQSANFDPGGKAASNLNITYATPACLPDNALCTAGGVSCCQGSCLNHPDLDVSTCTLDCDKSCSTQTRVISIYCSGGTQCRRTIESWVNCSPNASYCTNANNGPDFNCSLRYGTSCLDLVMCRRDSDCPVISGSRYKCKVHSNPRDNYCDVL